MFDRWFHWLFRSPKWKDAPKDSSLINRDRKWENPGRRRNHGSVRGRAKYAKRRAERQARKKHQKRNKR